MFHASNILAPVSERYQVIWYLKHLSTAWTFRHISPVHESLDIGMASVGTTMPAMIKGILNEGRFAAVGGCS